MTTLTSVTFRPILVPPEVAKCPICGEAIYVEEINEWDAETGEPTEHGFHVDCSTEPDIDSDEWWDFHHGHWSMPYVDWMPLMPRIHRWLTANFRMDVSD